MSLDCIPNRAYASAAHYIFLKKKRSLLYEVRGQEEGVNVRNSPSPSALTPQGFYT